MRRLNGRRRPVARVQMLFRSSSELHRRTCQLASFAQMMPCAPGANLLPNPPPYWVMVDVRPRNAEPLREPLPALDHRLRRDPRGQLVAVPLTHAAVRPEAHAADHVRRHVAPDAEPLSRNRRRCRLSLPSRPAACCRLGTWLARPPPSPVRCPRGAATLVADANQPAASSARSSVSAATAATDRPDTSPRARVLREHCFDARRFAPRRDRQRRCARGVTAADHLCRIIPGRLMSQ